jgi:hypothetical protein
MSSIHNEWGYQMNIGCPSDKPNVAWSDLFGYIRLDNEYSGSAPATPASFNISHDIVPQIPDIEGQMLFDFDSISNATSTTPVKPCTECKGTGKYIGLSSVEDCRVCSGSGKV